MKSGFIVNSFGICALSLLLVGAFNLAGDDDNTSLLDTSDNIFVNDAVIIDKFNIEHNFGFENQNEEEDIRGVESESEIKSSESKPSPEHTETQLEKQDIIIDAVSQNSGLLNEYSDTGQVLLTIVDSVNTELKNTVEQAQSQSEIPFEDTKPHTNTTPVTSHQVPLIPIKHSTSNLSENNNFSELITQNVTTFEEIPSIQVEEIIQEVNITSKVETKGEDIPSFAEWAQKQLEEAEKKKEILNVSVQGTLLNQNGRKTSNVKLRSKNYASPDCGAKIVAANSEATSPSSVLSPSKDEYMLNACTTRVWFIVELCEAVQVKRVELANFELFSSTPKEFTVQVSDRFPTRDWNIVGQFTAKDDRDIQAYDLQPNIFGKYVKVELHSHYGSEHFCPISLFRLYGISEFEVLETEEEATNGEIEDDDFVDEVSELKNEEPSNLFGSAREVVMSFVKKAVLVITRDSTNRTSQRTVDCNLAKLAITEKCVTPSHLIVCDNCSDLFFSNVFSLLSCRNEFLQRITESAFIASAITRTDMCVKYGLNFNSKGAYSHSRSGDVVTAFFGPEYIGALCNMFAIREKKVVLNTSNSINTNTTEVEEENEDHSTETEDIQPTKTLEAELVTTVEVEPSEPLWPIETEQTIDTKTSDVVDVETEVVISTVVPEIEEDNVTDLEKTVHEDSFEIVPELDSFLSEWEQNNNNHVTTTPVTPPSTMPQGQKESMFVRLFNRIKALERNMSLSSQYLEELSRRYKKQMEEMQRAYDQTLEIVNEKSKKNDELQKQYSDFQQQMGSQLTTLTTVVDTLLSERNSWSNAASWFMHFFIIQLFLASIILYFWGKTENKVYEEPKKIEETEIVVPKRRKSLDIVRHESPPKRRRRRPSEEALNITGTYNDLLIPDITDIDGNIPWQSTKSDKRRKRKKQSILRRSNSNSELQKPIVVLKKFSDSGDFRETSFISKPIPPPAPPLPVESTPIQNPIFMKTAISERGKRLSVTEKSYANGVSRSNSVVSSLESSQSLVPEKKEKKKTTAGGLKKIFKKVF